MTSWPTSSRPSMGATTASRGEETWITGGSVCGGFRVVVDCDQVLRPSL